MKIILYTDVSGASNEARAFLLGKGIPFEEVDAATPEGLARLLKRTQQRMVPAFELKRAHSIVILVGLDRVRLELELGISEKGR